MEIDRLLVLSELLVKAFAQTERLLHDPLSHSSTQNFKYLWFSSYLAFCPLYFSFSFSFMLSYSIHNLHVRAGISFEMLVQKHKFLIGLLLWDQKLTGSYTWKAVYLDASLKHRIFWRLRSSFQYLFNLNWFLYLL